MTIKRFYTYWQPIPHSVISGEGLVESKQDDEGGLA